MPRRARRTANLLNLSTPLGLGLARLGRARVTPGRHDLLLATGHSLPIPLAGAVTVGDVVLLRPPLDAVLEHDRLDPRMLDHEARHATQYAWCLGPVLLPLYAGAAGWSWLRSGDWWSRNIFETRAGLGDGGYVDRGTRAGRRREARIWAQQSGRAPDADARRAS